MNSLGDEMEKEAQRFLTTIDLSKEMDFEAVEFLARGASHRAGARFLEKLLASRLKADQPQAPICANHPRHREMQSDGLRPKTVLTIMGPVRIERRRFRCPQCGATAYPDDAALDVIGTKFSPATRKLMAHAGSDAPFAQASEALGLLAGIDTTAKAVERVAQSVGGQIEGWMQHHGAMATLGQCQNPGDATLYVSFDGTGVPMRKEALSQSKGKNGPARTREVKLGCVFTQTGLDEKGRPVRDEASTSYCGAIESSGDFGHRIHQEALRRGQQKARRTVVITDGATYNKTIIAEHFPNATAILDLYHAREHLAKFFRDTLLQAPEGPLYETLKDLLDTGQIETLLTRLRRRLPRRGERRKKALAQIAYFDNNKDAMRYGLFRKQGLFIGSGVIEAGCKTLIGKRLKNSGMFWSQKGANAIIALRCCKLSNRFDDFWEEKVA